MYEEARGCVRCPLHQTRTTGRVRRRERRRRADVRRRGAGGQRGPARVCRSWARRASCSTSCWPRSASSARTCSSATSLKCRPPGNRDPQPNEIESCQGYLRSQVELIEPTLICTLGNFSTKLLRGDTTGISRLHGQAEERVIGARAVRLYPLYHPAAALYTPLDAGGAPGRLPADSRSCWRWAPRAQPAPPSATEPEPVRRAGSEPELAALAQPGPSRGVAARPVLSREPVSRPSVELRSVVGASGSTGSAASASGASSGAARGGAGALRRRSASAKASSGARPPGRQHDGGEAGGLAGRLEQQDRLDRRPPRRAASRNHVRLQRQHVLDGQVGRGQDGERGAEERAASPRRWPASCRTRP